MSCLSFAGRLEYPRRMEITALTNPVNPISIKTKKAIDNLADVWKKLDELSPRASVVRPPGGFTVAEYCENRKCTRATAESQLRVLINNGKVNRSRVALPSQGGKIVSQWCYYLADNKE